MYSFSVFVEYWFLVCKGRAQCQSPCPFSPSLNYYLRTIITDFLECFFFFYKRLRLNISKCIKWLSGRQTQCSVCASGNCGGKKKHKNWYRWPYLGCEIRMISKLLNHATCSLRDTCVPRLTSVPSWLDVCPGLITVCLRPSVW